MDNINIQISKNEAVDINGKPIIEPSKRRITTIGYVKGNNPGDYQTITLWYNSEMVITAAGIDLMSHAQFASLRDGELGTPKSREDFDDLWVYESSRLLIGASCPGKDVLYPFLYNNVLNNISHSRVLEIPFAGFLMTYKSKNVDSKFWDGTTLSFRALDSN